jgi:hypothetical protein
MGGIFSLPPAAMLDSSVSKIRGQGPVTLENLPDGGMVTIEQSVPG